MDYRFATGENHQIDKDKDTQIADLVPQFTIYLQWNQRRSLKKKYTERKHIRLCQVGVVLAGVRQNESYLDISYIIQKLQRHIAGVTVVD